MPDMTFGTTPPIDQREFAGKPEYINHIAPPIHAAARVNAMVTCVNDLKQLFHLYLPAGRESSLAITNLEQARMWAEAAIKKAH